MHWKEESDWFVQIKCIFVDFIATTMLFAFGCNVDNDVACEVFYSLGCPAGVACA